MVGVNTWVSVAGMGAICVLVKLPFELCFGSGQGQPKVIRRVKSNCVNLFACTTEDCVLALLALAMYSEGCWPTDTVGVALDLVQDILRNMFILVKGLKAWYLELHTLRQYEAGLALETSVVPQILQ